MQPAHDGHSGQSVGAHQSILQFTFGLTSIKEATTRATKTIDKIGGGACTFLLH